MAAKNGIRSQSLNKEIDEQLDILQRVREHGRVTLYEKRTHTATARHSIHFTRLFHII